MIQENSRTNDTKASHDPLIDEVRAIRQKISDLFDNDVDRLFDHLKEVEKAYIGPKIRPEDAAALGTTSTDSSMLKTPSDRG